MLGEIYIKIGHAIEVSMTCYLNCDLYCAAGSLHGGNTVTTSITLLLPYRHVLVLSFIIKLSSFNILSVSSLLFPSLLWGDVTLPWSYNILHSPCRSICRLTCGSQEILNGDGLAAERLPLSNYMTASREGELLLHDPLMEPNIPFLFIPNLFVQSSPLMLAAPSSPRNWERGKRNGHETSSSKKSE